MDDAAIIRKLRSGLDQTVTNAREVLSQFGLTSTHSRQDLSRTANGTASEKAMSRPYLICRLTGRSRGDSRSHFSADPVH
jgi:hypothetical protein